MPPDESKGAITLSTKLDSEMLFLHIYSWNHDT